MTNDIEARSKKRAFLVFIGCCVMQAFGLGTVLNSSSAFFAIVPMQVGVGMPAFSMWITCYGIAALLGTFLAGILIPKLGAKLVMSVDVIVVALCLLAFTFMTPEWTWQFIAIGLVMGLFGGMFFLYACPLFMGAWFGKKVLGRYLGIANLMSGIGGAIFPSVFTAIGTNMGWQMMYYVNAVCVLVLLIFTLGVFHTDPRALGLKPYGATEEDEAAAGEKLPGVPLRYALPTVTFVLLIIGCAVSAFPGSYNSYVQANAMQVLGADAAQFSATLMIALQVGYILAALVGGFIVDKIGAFKFTLILYIILIVTYISWSAANSEIWMLVTAFFFGMNNAIVTISVPMLVRENFGMRDYDKILSYAMMAVGLMGSMGAPVIAFVFASTGSYSGSFIVGAVIAAIGIIIIGICCATGKKVKAAHWEA